MFDMTNFIATALKDNGLVIPVNFTEDEFFEAGRCLAKIERGMQWAIGDWYNSIPWGDKEAACKEVGLNFNNARDYAFVCAAFPICGRSANLGFAHHRLLAIQELTNNQRTELLEKSSKNGWTVSRLIHERDILLGRPEKVPVLEFDDAMDGLLEELPSSVSKKTKQGIRKVYDKMKSEFQVTVEEEVKKRLAVERSQVAEIRREVQEERKQLSDVAKGVTFFMSQEEFNLIRGLLHPDKHQNEDEDTRRKYQRAFEIFMRLENTISPYINNKVLEQRGWKS